MCLLAVEGQPGSVLLSVASLPVSPIQFHILCRGTVSSINGRSAKKSFRVRVFDLSVMINRPLLLLV